LIKRKKKLGGRKGCKKQKGGNGGVVAGSRGKRRTQFRTAAHYSDRSRREKNQE